MAGTRRLQFPVPASSFLQGPWRESRMCPLGAHLHQFVLLLQTPLRSSCLTSPCVPDPPAELGQLEQLREARGVPWGESCPATRRHAASVSRSLTAETAWSKTTAGLRSGLSCRRLPRDAEGPAAFCDSPAGPGGGRGRPQLLLCVLSPPSLSEVTCSHPPGAFRNKNCAEFYVTGKKHR